MLTLGLDQVDVPRRHATQLPGATGRPALDRQTLSAFEIDSAISTYFDTIHSTGTVTNCGDSKPDSEVSDPGLAPLNAIENLLRDEKGPGASLSSSETTNVPVIDPEPARAASSLCVERKVQVSVLVVDTQTLFRSGLAHLLSEDDHLSVVGVSEGGEDIPRQCREMAIDVVLTDIQVREWDGIELTRAICRVSPRTRVLVLASFADWRVIPAMASGAAGFLLKDAEPEALRSAVVAAHLGEQVLCAEAARWLLPEAPDYRLTRREQEVLRLVAQGAANKEIAQSLQLGDKTVRNYVSRLYRKLAMHNRADISSAAWHAHPANGHGLLRQDASK